MLWKLEQAVFDQRRAWSAPSQTVQAPASDEAFPTPGEVFGEMAITIAVFLVIALAMHLLVDMAGV